ncbi:hypothetical protein EW145_g548 [Phellinidium pouzarii]|uniref:Uncharacterized protein n=1 Tax=Phellinidium pouzarii TaxID=167371 RepID=A0A4S4LJP9_9AGAM|nr:hypothetical protein EW145_g548 [Phellinidium pouzarii]
MHAYRSTRLTVAQDETARLAALQAEIDCLQTDVEFDEEEAEKIVERHIKLLHDYNEAKDAAQLMIGKVTIKPPASQMVGANHSQLAVHKEITVKQLHEDYGLSADD